MKIQQILTLAGPNIWSRHPVLEAWVDLEDLKDSPSNSIPGFTDRLMGWLPSLIEHRCSVGERGGFLQRLRDGTWPGHIMEHVCLELQSLAGTPVGFGKARETSVEGVYKVAVRYHDERLGRAALATARDLVLAAAHGRPFDVPGELKKLAEIKDRYCLGPSGQAIVDAATARNIPHRRLNERSLVQLGQGKKQHRTWTAETDRTGAIAGWIAQDKELTKSLLRGAGVPVPRGRPVEDADDAWAAAQTLGLPVVVKPRDANHGRGVFTGLRTEAQVKRAHALALVEGSGVLVETFAAGAEHRLLVVGDKVVAAVRGDAAYVVGDGQRTVARLIDDQLNSDPRRGDDEASPLCYIQLDAIVNLTLEQQGHAPTSVPAVGEQVLIQRSDNLAIDVTDEVHPETAEQAVLATRLVGLDIAGLDLVCENIARPLAAQGGVFVEVNCGPALVMHLKPSVGRPRPVGEAIVDQLFAPGDDGRIPIACVTGTNGKTIVSTLLAHLLEAQGQVLALASSDGLRIGGRVIDSGDCAGPQSAWTALLNPNTEVAVFEAGRGGILREGLGFDKCDVAVVTNIGEADHLGQFDLQTPEQMVSVKRSAVDVVLPQGFKVLNAEDPLVADMTLLGRGATIFFAQDSAHPRLAAHRVSGGRSVYRHHGLLVAADGEQETVVARLEEIPLIHGGRVAFQVENVLAATAAAWALGLSFSVIRERLSSFRGDLDTTPGRFNVLAHGGGTLIVDDAHNSSALIALIAALPNFGDGPRTIAYSAGPGRRLADLTRQGAILGEAFDRVFLFHDPAARDRSPEETFSAFEAGLAGASRTQEVKRMATPLEAWSAAAAASSPGHLVVLQPEDQNPQPCVTFVRALTAESARTISDLVYSSMPAPGVARTQVP